MNATRFGTRAGAGRRLATALRVDRADIRPARGMVNFLLTRGDVIPGSSGGSLHREGVAMFWRLNAFFAISVNSPSLSMVNFSCCVGSAPKIAARVA